MDIWGISLVILCISIATYTSAFILTTSSDRATAGLDFNLTCVLPYAPFAGIRRDGNYECITHVDNGTCRLILSNPNYTCICNPSIRTIVLTIPGTYDIDILHGTIWQCDSFLENLLSNIVVLYVNVPITHVNLTAVSNDINPVEILSSYSQHFICTTDAGRPSARIQWYLSSSNITDASTTQPDICNFDCNGKVISSSVLVYIGNIIDTGKTIHCTANNLDGEVVKSQDRYIDILLPVTKVNLTATPSDENPIQVVAGSYQRFICTTDASRPAARIQWYLSGTNITDNATAQPSICSAGCKTVISSSILLYSGNITDNGKRIYCTALNVEGQSVNSTMKSIDILFPITKVNLTATPSDENPIKVVSGSYQRFICTTDAGKPAARIQWYLSGTNIADEASAQPSICSAGCETVISSSILSYIGNITDNGKTMYCTAVNVEGQSVNSTMKSIDILYEPLIARMPNINIIEGNFLAIYCNVVSNPDPTFLWWTRQKEPDFRLNNANLTISNIHRNDSDSYTCHAINILTPSGMSPQERTSEKTFDVNVQYQPVISDIQDYNVTEGKKLIIFPIIHANPQPTLFWWSRQNEAAVGYNGTHLTISNVQRNFSGNYTFLVRNTLTPSGMPSQERNSTKMFNVNVQYKPIISEIQDYNVTEGNDLQIYPVIDANPHPTLLWWTSQNEPDFIYYDNNLTIANIQRNSSGNYTCHVMNTLTPSGMLPQNRTSQKMFYVNVQYQPMIAEINDINITEGSSLAIYPVIDANPQSTSVWWSRQSEPYFRFYDTNFTINNIQRKSSGTYIFNAVNILTPSGMPQQKRTSQKMCYFNVQYKPVLSGSSDYNIEEGSTLSLSPTIDANPTPTYIWWTRENNTSFIYNDVPLIIKKIQQIDSGSYIVHVMNTLTPSGLPERNLTSQKMYNINVTVSTGSIAQHTSVTSDNSVIIGAGVGAGVIFISILVIGVLIFISRKRQINRRNEDSNERVYESTPNGPRQLSNSEMHVYNDLKNAQAEAHNLKKKTDESSYEEIGDVKRIRTENIYQNMTSPENESQKHSKERGLYVNIQL